MYAGKQLCIYACTFVCQNTQSVIDFHGGACERARVRVRYERVLKRVYVIPLGLRRGQESCLIGAHGPSSLMSVFIGLHDSRLMTHDLAPLLSLGHIRVNS